MQTGSGVDTQRFAQMAKRNIAALTLSDPINIRCATGTRNMQIFSQRNGPARYLLLTLERSSPGY